MADLHLVVDRSEGGLAGQIARELRESIRSGRLVQGTRLPASRDLAKDLGLSRGVVVEAYEQLVAEGFLEARTGAGTRVAAAARQHPDPPGHRDHAAHPDESQSHARLGHRGDHPDEPMVRAEPGHGSLPPREGPGSGDPGLASQGGAGRPEPPYYGHRSTSPDLGSFPRRAWLAAIRHVLTTLPHDGLDYGDPGGVGELRGELAHYLRRVRAADAAPENVVIVTGVAQGLSLVVHVLAAAAGGRRIVLAVEDPGSPRQLPLLRRAGAEVVRVPVDDEGMDVHALAVTGAEAVLLTPAHHYPTGIVMSPRRRADLMSWATGSGAVVLEDDYDAEFRFDRDPVGCLQGLAPDRVVLAGSVSKSLAPGLRLGWLVAPVHIAQAVRLARSELDLGSPVLDQFTLAHFIRTGGYDRHLRRMRREYRARRDALVRALAAHLPLIRVHGISAGLHLYAELPEGWDEETVVAAARSAGFAAEPVGPMRTIAAGRPPALVIGFARLPPHRVTRAVHELAETLGTRP